MHPPRCQGRSTQWSSHLAVSPTTRPRASGQPPHLHRHVLRCSLILWLRLPGLLSPRQVSFMRSSHVGIKAMVDDSSSTLRPPHVLPLAAVLYRALSSSLWRSSFTIASLGTLAVRISSPHVPCRRADPRTNERAAASASRCMSCLFNRSIGSDPCSHLALHSGRRGKRARHLWTPSMSPFQLPPTRPTRCRGEWGPSCLRAERPLSTD